MSSDDRLQISPVSSTTDDDNVMQQHSPCELSPHRQHVAATGQLASIVPTIGKEGHDIKRQSRKGHVIGVFTSGGDSQGMISFLFKFFV
jgi:hypothetical protein